MSVMTNVRRAWGVLRHQGPGAVVGKILVKFFPSALDRPTLVAYDDVVAADWRSPHPWQATPRALPEGPLTVAWVMSPPGANSGGHQNIFRFMKFLEDAGHTVRVYLTSTHDPTTVEEARARVAESSSYPTLAATIDNYPADGMADDVDVIVATGWETAYRSFADRSTARRFYFVQDFEPMFYPTGSEALLAENSYRFGFIGITAGEWLARKLRDEFDMVTSSFTFGAESRNYRITNTGHRNAVFFYARPETPRRGFELGAMALDLFARERPDNPIILAGQDVSRMRLPFAYENPGNVQVGELNELYNRCAAGLVLSLTNMSLLPLELLAAGVIPVVNDAPNNRLVSDNKFIEYTQPSPRALADRLVAIVDRADQAEHALRASASVGNTTWERAGEQFLEAFERGIRG